MWLGCVALAALAAGLGIGGLRLEAISRSALDGDPGARLELRGHLASSPRHEAEGLSAELATDAGRVLLRAADLHGLGTGAGVRVRGRLAEPAAWRVPALRRRGMALALDADRVEPTGAGRSGLAGAVDRVRARAEKALGRGMPTGEAALARGFVLGQDDAIDAATREDFRRSGLAHLLAVSGQNVVLLCLLAWPLLAVLGLTLRARLLVLLALIALYVPVTGAGPSIQRAGVMGAAGIVAALADRPRSRWYALLLAAVLTLALNPRASEEVGWQLSFAAVIGIFLWTARLASLLSGDAARGSARRALAEGVAMTVAATVATAPLMVHHFEAFSPAAVPANILALPAVAPAMWLGMLTAIAGQIPALPVEPLNWLDSLCLAYIAQVADWLGSPRWALAQVRLATPVELAGSCVALALLVESGLRMAERRQGLGPASLPNKGKLGGWRAAAALAALAALLAPWLLARPEPGASPAGEHLQVRVLDVGQGDAILLDPPSGDAVLVDAGPPGAGVAGRLRELGVERLAAIAITHDQSDHAGGLAELLAAIPVARVGLAAPSPGPERLAAAAGAELVRLAEAAELRSGGLRLTVLWPPRELLGGSAEDPNRRSAVMLAEWRHFSMLLTGDAEAEAVPVEPGPVDVLKVAHHGSEDAGLARLLETSVPDLGVVSVGENGYGHPTPETLDELRRADVATARTDRDGEVAIEADGSGWWVSR